MGRPVFVMETKCLFYIGTDMKFVFEKVHLFGL